MKKGIMSLLVFLFLIQNSTGNVEQKVKEQPLRVITQQRVPSGLDNKTYIPADSVQFWKPAETAIIVCDMWDRHWCRDASNRVAEMAPSMNTVLNIARKKGIKIVYAPSDCMEFYKDYPGRKEACKYYDSKIVERAGLVDGQWLGKLLTEENAIWPVDQSDEGCENFDCKPEHVWKRQIKTLTVNKEDLISDSGTEIAGYFSSKGIKNVILMGVHTNMCVIGRPFGLRAMKKLGMNVVLMRDMTDLMYNHGMWPYVNHFAGLDLMVKYIESYVCPTILSTDLTGKQPFKFKDDKQAFWQSKYSDAEIAKDKARGIILPKTDNHYKAVQYYVENDLDKDYIHAPEKSYEAFRDMKFAVRIHWGIYSIKEMDGESWGYLKLSSGEKTAYNELYKTFNPTGFDAQEWMDLFKRSGIKAFAFTTKHHEGFSMFHTKTRVKQRVNYRDTTQIMELCDLAYSIEETPFKRDIVKELCDAAHKNDIKIDLYFSHPDWYDADFRPYSGHPLLVPDFFTDTYRNYGNGPEFSGALPSGNIKQFITPNRTQEETARMIARHREQLHELLTNYGKIDMLCLDMWMGSDIWPQIKETVKLIRQWQPDIMIRSRGIGSYGDYYTPEGFVPGSKENTNMPWMTIYPLGNSFSYDKNGDNYKGTQWIIHNIIDCAAKGGSFMVGIGPDGNGKFHPKAVEQLEKAGSWLKVNGEGIYATRDRAIWKDNDIYFTRTKDLKTVFAFTEKWPEKEIFVPSIQPQKESKVYLLGYAKPLRWTLRGNGVKIEIPEELQFMKNRPCEYAWGFKIKVE